MCKKTFSLTLAIAWAALMASAAVQADICTYLVSSGDWSTGGNWNCGHVPGAGDTAIIPNGSTVTITAAATCNIVEVDAGGLLIIEGPTSSTRDLYLGNSTGGTSTIDGTLAFTKPSSGTARLKLSDNVVLSGTGTINASDADGYDPGILFALDTGADVEIDAGLTVKGDLEIYTSSSTGDIVNDGLLLVDDADDEMLFGPTATNTNKLLGSGELRVTAGAARFRKVNLDDCAWAVTLSGGAVQLLSTYSPVATASEMSYTVSGGTLTLDADHGATAFTQSGGTIDFNAALRKGDFTMSGGTLLFDVATNSTTSNLTITGGTVNVNATVSLKDLGWRGGSFVIAANQSATFNP